VRRGDLRPVLRLGLLARKGLLEDANLDQGDEDSPFEQVVLLLHLLYPLLDHAEPQGGLPRDSGFASSTSIFENRGHHHPDHEALPHII